MFKRFFNATPPADAAPPTPESWGEVLAQRLPETLAAAAHRLLVREADRKRFLRSESQFSVSGVRDFEFSESPHDSTPERVFDRLRWGGQLIFVSTQLEIVEDVAASFQGKPEWLVECEPSHFQHLRHRPYLSPLPMPASLRRRLFEQRLHYIVVRKVLLDPVSRLTAKHSYDVRLVRAHGRPQQDHANDGWVVLKRVPTAQQAISRLKQTCPGVPPEHLGAIAEKLCSKVFPVFLTREAAFLKLLQRDLPEAMKNKTPQVLSMETDNRGLVRSMTLRWMRQGCEPISQTEFAKQAAELLRAVHERVGVMHLDLRLDNMLITDDGVCLVDFGTAIRIGEDITANPMLNSLVREMLGASQVTRDLTRQRGKNLIRAEVFKDLPYPPSPAFDLFALATNMTRPHDNADFKGLVTHQRHSEEGQYFSSLRRRILKPKAQEKQIRDIHDLCVELGLGTPRPTRAQGSSTAPAATLLDGPSSPHYHRPSPQVRDQNRARPGPA